MKPLERRAFTSLHLLVTGTGLVYLYLKYFLKSDAPFAIVQHPWQPTIMAIHIVVASAFIAFFGMLLRSHILPKLRHRRPENRRTGWIAFVSFLVMALSGYMLQVSSSTLMIKIWMWTHIVAGILFAIIYALHFALSRRIVQRRQRV